MVRMNRNVLSLRALHDAAERHLMDARGERYYKEERAISIHTQLDPNGEKAWRDVWQLECDLEALYKFNPTPEIRKQIADKKVALKRAEVKVDKARAERLTKHKMAAEEALRVKRFAAKNVADESEDN